MHNVLFSVALLSVRCACRVFRTRSEVTIGGHRFVRSRPEKQGRFVSDPDQ